MQSHIVAHQEASHNLCFLLNSFPKSDFLSVITTDRLILGIYPDEIISMTFQTKNPVSRVCLRSVKVDFHYHQDYTCPIPNAYEKALLEYMLGRSYAL